MELKKHSPDLLLIKCVCHSVQLAVNYACKKLLPEDLEYLIYETYNWFSKSSHRQTAYRQIYELMNDDKVWNVFVLGTCVVLSVVFYVFAYMYIYNDV